MGWDDNGLPTERRVQNYYGVRCDPSLPYDPDFVTPTPASERPKDEQKAMPARISRRNFIELCDTPHRRGREGLRGPVPPPRPVGRLGAHLRHHRRPRPPGRPAGVPAQPASGARRTRPRRPRSGTSTSRRPSPRPSSRTASAAAPTTGSPSTAPTAATSSSRPPAPSCSPPASRWSPTPTTSATSRCSAPPCARRCSASRCRCSPHPLADPEKGTGIAMICTFGDLTDVIWWRELRAARPGPSSAATAASRAADAEAIEPRRAPRALRGRARPARRSRGAQAAHRRAARASRASCVGEPEPITHPVKFYEKGDRPLEIVTSRQWYIRNGGRDAELRDALLERGRELHWHPRLHARRYENWVDGLNGDWLVSRQRFFGVPFPVWYPLDADGEPDSRPRRSWPTRPRCRSTPPPTCPPGYDRGPARRARRLRRRPRRDGHVGDLVADPADRRRLGRGPRPLRAHLPDGPAPAGPRHHPHLAVLHGGARPPRARLAAVDQRRASPAGCSTPTARRCRSRRATSSRRSTCSSSTAPTPCATGRRAAAPAPTPRSTRAR